MSDELKKLQEENEKLKKEIRLYTSNAPARAYYVAQKMLNQQLDWLDKFSLPDEIKGNPKDDKVYDRSMDIFQKLTSNATAVNNLYIELNLTGDSKKDVVKRSLSAEHIADAVGELAGRKTQ